VAYQQQLEMLTRVRSAVAEVATSRKRLVLQAGQLEQQIDKVGDRGRKAMEVGGGRPGRGGRGMPGRCPGAAS
jgi:phage shock protein A